MEVKPIDHRRAPSNWHVLTNNGTNITAKNTFTGESFSGTLLDFNAMLNGTVPSVFQMGASYCIGQKNTAVVAPNDLLGNALFKLWIPGNTMDVNDSLRVSFHITCTNNANTKTLALKLGAFGSTSGGLGSQSAQRGSPMIHNRGSVKSQLIDNPLALASVGIAATVDMTKPQLLQMVVQKAVADDVVTLEYITVELLKGV